MTKLITILATAAAAGCVDYSTYTFDRDNFRFRQNEQAHRIYELEKDMIILKRGYTFVPVKVSITNVWEEARQ